MSACFQPCGHHQLVPNEITYPFEAKSIAYLRAGQFWGVPLSNGWFGCGRVLYVPKATDPKPNLYLNTRGFFGGLMDWSGDEPPTSEAIAGSKLLTQGKIHVVALKDTDSKILGQRDLALDNITGLTEISHRAGGTVWLYEGAARLRPATGEERRTLPIMSTWGRRVIQVAAEKYLVRGDARP
jgi:hypothetical protein